MGLGGLGALVNQEQGLGRMENQLEKSTENDMALSGGIHIHIYIHI